MKQIQIIYEEVHNEAQPSPKSRVQTPCSWNRLTVKTSKRQPSQFGQHTNGGDLNETTNVLQYSNDYCDDWTLNDLVSDKTL